MQKIVAYQKLQIRGFADLIVIGWKKTRGNPNANPNTNPNPNHISNPNPKPSPNPNRNPTWLLSANHY